MVWFFAAGDDYHGRWCDELGIVWNISIWLTKDSGEAPEREYHIAMICITRHKCTVASLLNVDPKGAGTTVSASQVSLDVYSVQV